MVWEEKKLKDNLELTKLYIEIGIIKELFDKEIINEQEMNVALKDIYNDNKLLYEN